MSSLPSCGSLDDPAICRRCARCGGILCVTSEDELVCHRHGRVRAWTVSVNGKLVAAGRKSLRGGIGIWLAGKLDDLRPAPVREPAPSRSGHSEDD
jgi:hypothetical protein